MRVSAAGDMPAWPFRTKRRMENFGAGNEVRTRDLDLGKVALYQLSYTRFKPRRLFFKAA